MILCLTGMPGSGKSTAAKIFSDMGFDVIEGSAVIKEEMRKRGITVDSESLEAFVSRMKSEKGKAVFAAMTGEKVKADLDRNILVIGLRSIAEFEQLENSAGCKIPLIVIIAPSKLRFERLSERKTMAIKDHELFLTRDKNNIGQGITDLIDRADYVISNTGSKKELEESLRLLLARIKGE